MTESRKTELSRIAYEIRKGAIVAVASAASGHPGGSLSIADVLAYLYFEEMNIDPTNPSMESRDRLVLSKGHAAPALYAALALRGFFAYDELLKLRQVDGMLQGHPDMKHIPGVDMSAGSLGLGVSAACGMALAAKHQKQPWRVYAIAGDGESEEGQVWESAMFAAHYQLDNYTLFVDCNGLQIDGAVSEVMNPMPMDEKYRAFGWNVITIDAHNFDEIEAAVTLAKSVKGKPTAIIMTSVKGKGVSYMENAVEWHGAAPKGVQTEQAVAELDAKIAELQ